MKHTNKIAIKVLSEEYEDYKYREGNSWHYDRQYKMIEKALSEFEKLNKSDVISSVCTCTSTNHEKLEKFIIENNFCNKCKAKIVQIDL